jgi:antitoxin VapB
MALNIKSESAHRLARELAEATGVSLTEAVTTALERSVASTARSGSRALLLAEVEAIQRFVADLPDRDARTADEILDYDDRGLPR